MLSRIKHTFRPGSVGQAIVQLVTLMALACAAVVVAWLILVAFSA